MTEPATYDDLPRQTSTVERVVTALLMVGLAVLVPVASFLGLFFAMVSDGCTGDTECNGGQIGLGVPGGPLDRRWWSSWSPWWS